MCITCHKIPAPVSMVHPSLEFQCPAPPGIVKLSPTKGKGQRFAKCVSAPTATAPNSGTALSLPALSLFLYESFPTQIFGEQLQYLTPVLKDSVKPLFLKQQVGEWTTLNFSSIEHPVSSIFLLAHCSNPSHCVLLSCPVFSRTAKAAFRQIGKMFIESEW